MNYTERFIKWVKWIISWEGEAYENDPDDPGGETKYGIDKRSHPKVDIKNLTKDKAIEIYYNSYWIKNKCDIMPEKVGEVYGNICVNMGSGNASKWIQEVLGLKADGIIGPKTIEAISKIEKPNVIAHLLILRIEKYYKSLASEKPKFAKYLKGWLNRTSDLRKLLQLN